MKLAWLFCVAAALPTVSAASSHSTSSITVVVRASRSVVIAQIPTPFTFKGYECTVDCEGHEAGYEWAEEKGIDDPDDCGGNSQSFIEGCRAYAEEQNELLRGNEGSDEDDNDNDNDDDD